MKTRIKTPVVITIWNQKDTIERVFKKIKEVKPPMIYAISDGGRNEKEQLEINSACKVLDKINWKCEVIKDFVKKNQGPKKRLGEGFTNFFKYSDRGIFFEHDCLPDTSFFYFCEDLLEKYKNNNKIMHISGNNFQNGIKRGVGSYYFSSIPNIWGWATWKRAWNHYDYKMQSYDPVLVKKKLNKVFNDRRVTKYWLDIFDKTYQGEINTWDYQWAYSTIINEGLSINPQKNLVTNIGFHPGAANTTDVNHPFAKLPLHSVGKLKHPKKIERNDEADKLILRQNFQIDFYHIWVKPIQNRLKGIWLMITNPKLYKKIKNS